MSADISGAAVEAALSAFYHAPGPWGSEHRKAMRAALAAAEPEMWQPAETWKRGADCLIVCRGARPEAGYRGTVSKHYGMTSFPTGTTYWRPIPTPPGAKP